MRHAESLKPEPIEVAAAFFLVKASTCFCRSEIVVASVSNLTWSSCATCNYKNSDWNISWIWTDTRNQRLSSFWLRVNFETRIMKIPDQCPHKCSICEAPFCIKMPAMLHFDLANCSCCHLYTECYVSAHHNCRVCCLSYNSSTRIHSELSSISMLIWHHTSLAEAERATLGSCSACIRYYGLWNAHQEEWYWSDLFGWVICLKSLFNGLLETFTEGVVQCLHLLYFGWWLGSIALTTF